MKKCLITYMCVNQKRNNPLWGYEIADDPLKWLESTQEYQDETYYIVNVLPVTDEWVRKWDGALKGL